MKHRALWISTCIFLLATTFCRTAIQPSRFTGVWQGTDGIQYIFQEGIITTAENPKHSCLQGAYAFTRDSITLFVSGSEHLNTVRTLYWIHHEDGDVLCDDPKGSGTVHFYRNTDDA